MSRQIISVGISPAWDRTIELKSIGWGEHKNISRQTLVPAGKSLNINKALAQMKITSTAAGLWGSDDFTAMQAALTPLSKYIKTAFTKVAGKTRENITIIDTAQCRQMHLRFPNPLVQEKNLELLTQTICSLSVKENFVVFAGSLASGKPLRQISCLFERLKKAGALIIVDSSGAPLKKIVSRGGLFLIKPNLEELEELLGKKIINRTNNIVFAARKLLNKTKLVLVSRGAAGAVLVGDGLALNMRPPRTCKPAKNTVGCGDYLLAGFLGAMHHNQSLKAALKQAVSLAAKRAAQ